MYSGGGSWYPEACRPLGLEHRLHTPYEKSLKAIEYIKDRVEGFDDYYPCLKEGCDLKHVDRWLHLYTHLHNTRRRHNKFTQLLNLLRGEQTLS